MQEGFDPARIDWPSNRITVGQMRAHEPRLYISVHRALQGDGLEALDICYNYELLAAERVFAFAKGRPDPDRMVPRGMILDQLEESYVKYGICAGRAEAKELLRRIEDAAIKQAIEQGGRDPRRRR